MNSLQEQLQPLKNRENTYQKKYKTFDEQLILLKSRGLVIANEAYVLSKLQHINYYRLSAYFPPFQYRKNTPRENEFLEGTTFEDIIKLYYFDTELRKVIFEAIEVIEIYLRTQIAYAHSKEYEAFGYLDIKNLRENKQEDFDALHKDILKEKERSKEAFIKHFRDKYKTTDLPIWSVTEIISFGSLSKLFMLLKEQEQNEVISKMGSVNKVVFYKWFKALSSVRNTCAHHSRIWNKILGVGFQVPRGNQKFESLGASKNKIFFALSVIEYMLVCMGEDEVDFKTKLISLLHKYPDVNIEAMGFPNDWEKLEIWRDYE